MTYWKEHLRANLPSLAADPAREAEIVEELAQHLADREAEVLSAGANAEKARATACAEVPDKEKLARAIREVDLSHYTPPAPPVESGSGRIGRFVRDVRYAVRLLVRSPGFAVVTILTLALGIGATTTIFSLVNGVLLKPLPYPDQDRLMGVFRLNKRLMARNPSNASLATIYAVPPAVFEDWKDDASIFESLGAYTTADLTVKNRDEAERISGAAVTSGVFAALQVPPLIGRALAPEDDRVGSQAKAVLSYGFWQSRFGADPKAMGRQLIVDGTQHTITGVMPPGFSFPDGGEQIWVTLDDQRRAWPTRKSGFLQVLGRLRMAMPVQQVQLAMEDISRRIAQEHPEDKDFGVRVLSRREMVTADARPRLLLMQGAGGAVLLIACANIANLLLIRATGRRKEVGVRQALGAPRGRLLEQFITESLVLSFAGGLAGFLMAAASVRPFMAVLPFTLQRADEISIDYRLVLFAIGVSIFVGVIIGVLPALRAIRVPALEALRDLGPGLSGGRCRNRTQSVLVVSQVVLAFLLLSVTGLFIRSLARMNAVSLGFKPEQVLTMDIGLGNSYSSSDSRMLAFFQNLTGQLAAIPGVQAVATAGEMPFSGGYSAPPTSIETATGVVQANIHSETVAPSHFKVMSIPIMVGRAFTVDDRDVTVPVAVINHAMVREYWPNENPIGRRVRIDVPDPHFSRWLTVVGVVSDTRFSVRSNPFPVVYLAYAQQPSEYQWILLKTDGHSAQIAADVRAAVRTVDRDIPVTIRTLSDQIHRDPSLAFGRFVIILLGALAVTAALLAALGIYGVLAYAVAQRTHEIGIRIALGASCGSIIGRVMRLGLAMAGIGLALGLGSAVAVSRALRSLLFGVDPMDPATLGTVILVVATTAIVASLVAARRATKVEPLQALKCE